MKQLYCSETKNFKLCLERSCVFVAIMLRSNWKYLVDEHSDGNNDKNDETFAAYDEREKKKDMLNESLNIFGVSPIKTHSMWKKCQVSSTLEKLERNFEKQEAAGA